MRIDLLQNNLHLADDVAMYTWCEWNKSITEDPNIYSQDAVKNDILSNTICFLALTDSDDLAGFICVGKCDFPSRYQHLTPWIQNFYVLSQYRNKWLGSRLFDHALNYCLATKISIVYLWTYDDHLSYYQRRGFQVMDKVGMQDGIRYVMRVHINEYKNKFKYAELDIKN